MFDVNITLVIQLVNFIVTLVVLNFLLIRPVRDIIRKRRDLATGLLTEAEQFTTNAAEKLENYEAVLAKAREEAAHIRETRKNEARAHEAEALETAHREAQEFLQTSREETRKAVDGAFASIEKRIPDLGKMVAAQLLGKSKRSSAA